LDTHQNIVNAEKVQEKLEENANKESPENLEKLRKVSSSLIST